MSRKHTAFQRVFSVITVLFIGAGCLQIGQVYVSSVNSLRNERFCNLHKATDLLKDYAYRELMQADTLEHYEKALQEGIKSEVATPVIPMPHGGLGYHSGITNSMLGTGSFSQGHKQAVSLDDELQVVYRTARPHSGIKNSFSWWPSAEAIYVAAPVIYGGNVIGAVWASSPTEDIYRTAMWATAKVCAVYMLFLLLTIQMIWRFLLSLQKELAAFTAAVATGGSVLVSAATLPELVPLYESVNEARGDVERFFALGTDGMCAISLREGNFLTVNHAWLQILGYTRDEMIGHSVFEFLHPDDALATKKYVCRAKAGKEPQHYENRFRCKDGSYKSIAWRTAVDARKALVYAVGRDMTAHRINEEDMMRLDRMSLAAQLATSISHEIRNPMTTIRGFLQLLCTKYTATTDAKYFKLMMEELDRANGIISEYLSLAKNRPRQMKPTDLVDVIQCVLPLIKADSLLTNKNIDTQFRAVPEIMADERALRQLLLNLVRNGLESMGENKTLTICVYPEHDYVVLQVMDEGAGIPEYVMQKLGTPFLTTKENGTGLGLSVCYRIIEEHNASVSVESSPEGTIFTICFPSSQV